MPLVFISTQIAHAATTPSLGQADSFGVLSSTYTNTASGTSISGDLGYTTGPAVAPTVSGITYSPPAGKYTASGDDQVTALNNLNAQTCDFNFGTATDLSLLPQPLAPGVYCITGAASIGTGITLSGAGTFIFRIVGALNSPANSVVGLTGGASVCDIFWTPTGATTLGANSTFAGTDIDAAGITIGSTVIWNGRALAFGGTVSTDADTITVPTCIVSTPTPTSTPAPTITPTLTPTQTPSPTSSAGSTSSSTSSNNSSSDAVQAIQNSAPKLPNTGMAPKKDVYSSSDLNSSSRLVIPAINVDADIQNVGINTKGEMDVPTSIARVGLYGLGANPGEIGNAVIDGHLEDENGKPAVFANLDRLRVGDKLYINNKDGKSITFTVRETRSYDSGYADDVFKTSDKSHLNLITCDGVWDKNKKSYNKRLVVFADIAE